MIGILADPVDHAVVREFFELFKTPWEFYQPDRTYDVLLSTVDRGFNPQTAKLVILYAGKKTAFDADSRIEVAAERSGPQNLLYKTERIPVHGSSVAFPREPSEILIELESRLPAMVLRQTHKGQVARIGYALFAEVKHLLTSGQPVDDASCPTMELHIALLRDVIVRSGLTLSEIPPVPEGYRFIACLTHDVDHPLLTRHKFDHTAAGFFYRATLGTIKGVARRRRPARHLLRNLTAAVKLPFVHARLARDFWADFDRYVELEEGAPSSFFVIPFKDRPGRRQQGHAPKRRAARYGAADIAQQIKRLSKAGCEIGLHGIDAWMDSSAGRLELEEIHRLTGAKTIGVRMHWLYSHEQSPEVLESAGADYDSTVGYNQTVGYRAGTTQVYKPLAAKQLVELPLHIMDTALFYPSYLNLTHKEAASRVGAMIDNAVKFGGCVTVNWHDRSIAPERCWDDFYHELLEQLKSKGAWFATAANTVAWFRKRRSATFKESRAANSANVESRAAGEDKLPDLQVRVSTDCQAETATCIS